MGRAVCGGGWEMVAHSGGKQGRRREGKAIMQRLLAQVLLFAPGDGQKGERGNLEKKNNKRVRRRSLGECEGFCAHSLSLLPGWSGKSPFPARLFLLPLRCLLGRGGFAGGTEPPEENPCQASAEEERALFFLQKAAWGRGRSQDRD